MVKTSIEIESFSAKSYMDSDEFEEEVKLKPNLYDVVCRRTTEVISHILIGSHTKQERELVLNGIAGIPEDSDLLQGNNLLKEYAYRCSLTLTNSYYEYSTVSFEG